MGQDTKIEWAHDTFNVWVGCARVSPGCENCYAESWSGRELWRSWLDSGWTLVGDADKLWGRTGARLFPPDRYWRQLYRWNAAAERAGERRRVFVSSLADVLEVHPDLAVAAAQNDARGQLAVAIAECPWLDFLLVTKRPENWHRMDHRLTEVDADLRNVWVIVTAEDQQRADERVPLLLAIPDVAVRGVSYEPALGLVDLGMSSATCDCCPRWTSRWVRLNRTVRADDFSGVRADPGLYRAHSNRHGALSVSTPHGLLGIKPREFDALPGLNWVIAGSESGPGARPVDLDWIRSARDQCVAAGVPFFLKQLPGQVRGSKLSLPKLDGKQWAQVPTPEVTSCTH